MSSLADTTVVSKAYVHVRQYPIASSSRCNIFSIQQNHFTQATEISSTNCMSYIWELSNSREFLNEAITIICASLSSTLKQYEVY